MAVQRDQIVATALDLLDRVGADGLTMRVLARELKIKAPSLYWHFSGKRSLLDAMADAIVAQADWDFAEDREWATILARFAHEMRRALLRHRDGARVFAGTFPVTDNILRIGDAVIGPLHAAGLSLRDAAWAMFTINYFVIGFVLEEQAMQQANDEAAPTPASVGREITSHAADHPTAAAGLLALLEEDADSRFAFGLETIVAGLGTRLRHRR